MRFLPGDRVGIVSRNYPEFIFAFWAVQLLGAVAVCPNACVYSLLFRRLVSMPTEIAIPQLAPRRRRQTLPLQH